MGGPERPGASGFVSGVGETVSTGGLSRAQTAQPMELQPGDMVGEYRVDQQIGEGGMGKVYSATHPVIAKRAAIKILHPELSMNREAVERFVQEARSVNQIGHPNIVDIFSFGTLPDARCYFVMEWLRGESLRDRLRKVRVSLPEALAFCETIAVALEAAHEKGIVHRDLKPDNIYLCDVKGSAAQVKLLDFGIAKLLAEDGRMERTRTGNLMGTPAYMSPEQARGQAVDHRTDIYALGCVAYEMFTGWLPFPADNAADMIAKHLFEQPPSARQKNPGLPPELDGLVMAMLAKDARSRPTLAQIREEMRRALQFVSQPSYGGRVATPAAGVPQYAPMMTPSSIGPQMTPGMVQTGAGMQGSMHTPMPGTMSVMGTQMPTAPRRSKLPLIIISAVVAAAIGVALVVGTSSNGTQAKDTTTEPATATETVKPADPPTDKTVARPDTTKPADVVKPADTTTPPVDTTKPADVVEAADTTTTAVDTTKPADTTTKPADTTKPVIKKVPKKTPKVPPKRPGTGDDDAPM
ncbi:MAG: Protein kinase [Myxococcales bacterium]|nr:Protein kinase [Myxococcales bacterium]